MKIISNGKSNDWSLIHFVTIRVINKIGRLRFLHFVIFFFNLGFWGLVVVAVVIILSFVTGLFEMQF